MVKKQLQLTKDGLEALKKELSELNNVKRPKLVDRLSYARSQGDLTENSDYSNAKEELEFMDGRIEELEMVIKNAKVIDSSLKSDGVNVGTKVTVRYDHNQAIFEIVGDWEADPVNKKISPDSPLGMALIGKKVGDKAEVQAPAGKLTYEILAIN